MKSININRTNWLLISIVSLVASAIGVFNIDIYAGLVIKDLMPGVFGQDLMTIAAAILLGLLALITKDNHINRKIIALGILGYLFYAYGIYVIEQVYNMLYLLYMLIFTLSFWGMIYGVATLGIKNLDRMTLPQWARRISIGVTLLQPIVFYPLWISALLPLMREGNRIENLFSVYILDLCFIMPAFLAVAWMLIKKETLGYVLTPALFILGFTLIFSLTVSELMKPFFDTPLSPSGIWLSGGLSALFLVASFIHVQKLRYE